MHRRFDPDRLIIAVSSTDQEMLTLSVIEVGLEAGKCRYLMQVGYVLWMMNWSNYFLLRLQTKYHCWTWRLCKSTYHTNLIKEIYSIRKFYA